MLIFTKEELIFFAIPKTASTSIENTIGRWADIRLSRNPALKHTTFRKYEKLLAPFVHTVIPKPALSVALFREPVDWLGSWYRYRQRHELIGSQNSTHGITFDQFIEAYLTDAPPAFARLGRQSKFVSKRDGQVGISQLFRFDDMTTFVTFLEDRLKQIIKLPHMNISPRAELSLRPDLKQELQTVCTRDFEIYESIKRLI